ncbi:MAG: 5-methylaminomethyl-2-thiouridine methyltransferase [Rhodocyclales bacterium]|nr:5-methylaminomethyl-2-thiouridine methyltransferase [Rhodocyclales bacterium]
MSTSSITPGLLDFGEDGTPFSQVYGDVYHTAGGALDQARHVFLGGNGLPARWQGRKRFVIVETGFGLGHNFLATWQAWRTDPQAGGRLHFVSTEKHPVSAADLARAHAASGVQPLLSQQLLAQWPLLLPGFHRLEFDAGRVILTLLFGDAARMLSQCVARADAIYLDGFAPAKNPQMWSAEVFAALAGLSQPGTTLATWSVASKVRADLTEAGFDIHKTQGFTGKREMLVGQFGTSTTLPVDRHIHNSALVIGAGLAGSSITERLAARGWQVTLIDEQPAAAQGASGNFAGAFRPQPSRDDNLMARITRAGFAYGLRDLASLAERNEPVRWSQCGVLHLARDATQEGKQQQAVASQTPPADFMQWLDAAEASKCAGRPCPFGGWWFPLGGWVSPPSLCAAHLAAARHYADARIGMHFNCRVARIERREVDGELDNKSDGELDKNMRWHALDENANSIASAAHLVLANAHDAHRLLGKPWLPLYSARGQVSHLPAAQFQPLANPLERVICGSGYLTPAIDGLHALGATFVVNDPATDLRENEHVENLAKLDLMLPDASHDIDVSTLDGRAGLRPITPDRLPFVGAIPSQDSRSDSALQSVAREPQLWLLSGFGARGLVWGMLCAELLASQMNDEPLPLERELVEAMDAARYLPRK